MSELADLNKARGSARKPRRATARRSSTRRAMCSPISATAQRRCATSSAPPSSHRARSTTTSNRKRKCFKALQDETRVARTPALRAERIRARGFENSSPVRSAAISTIVKNDQTTFIAVRRHREIPRVRIDTPEVIAGFDELRADIEIAIENGVLPPADPDLLMAPRWWALAFEVAHQMLVRDDISADDAAKFATALFLGGVQALPKSRSGEEEVARHTLPLALLPPGEGGSLPKAARRMRASAAAAPAN